MSLTFVQQNSQIRRGACSFSPARRSISLVSAACPEGGPSVPAGQRPALWRQQLCGWGDSLGFRGGGEGLADSVLYLQERLV